MQKNRKQTAAHTAQDKGFYIILILCAAAIAISGYVLFFAPFGDGASMETVDYVPSVAPGEGWQPASIPAEEEPAAQVILPDAAPVEDVPAEPPAETPNTELSPAQDTAAGPTWVQPVDGEVVQAWSGDRLVYHNTLGDWRVHDGVDYLAPAGTRIYAVSKGEIIDVTADSLWATSVTLRLSDGRVATYRGLSDDLKVKTGSQVQAGDVIGTVAAVVPVEADLGAHLHFELCDANGVSINPEPGVQPPEESKKQETFLPSGVDVEE